MVELMIQKIVWSDEWKLIFGSKRRLRIVEKKIVVQVNIGVVVMDREIGQRG